MQLLTLPLSLPFLPVSGAVRLIAMIAEEADREFRDPVRVRRELEEAQRRRDAGEISEEDLARFEEQAMSLLLGDQAGPDDDGRQRHG
jgi:hypothetical protein